MEIIKIDAPELNGIEPSKAEQIKKTFEPMANMLKKFETAYAEVIEEAKDGITAEVVIKARRIRLDISKIRIETEKVRKEQKAEYLRAGQAIDGVSKILKWAISDKEEKLAEIEKHQEIQEKKRLDELQIARAEELSLYVEDAHERKLAEMDDDVWSAYLGAKKKEHEDRIEAEKKAEQERIAKEKADAEERERLKKENEALLKKQEETVRLQRILTEKREKEEAERIAKEKAIKKAQEEALAKERAEKERIAKELEAKKELDRQLLAQQEARHQEELNKGDSDKVKDLINDLIGLKTKYEFKSAKNKRMYSDTGILIDKVINNIKQ